MQLKSGNVQIPQLQGAGQSRDVRRVNFGAVLQGATVLVSITGFDIDGGRNARVTVGVQDLDDDGFNLVTTTWADSIIYAVWVQWVAIVP